MVSDRRLEVKLLQDDNINRKPAGNMENKINKASNGGQNKLASYKFYMQNAKYIINV